MTAVIVGALILVLAVFVVLLLVYLRTKPTTQSVPSGQESVSVEGTPIPSRVPEEPFVPDENYQSMAKDLPEPQLHAEKAGQAKGWAYFAASDVGKKRKNNEDNFAVVINELEGRETGLVMVADGMGGGEKGEVASTLAVTYLPQRLFTNGEGSLQERLRHSISQVNTMVRNEAHLIGKGTMMGSTLVGAVLQEKHATIFNVGDSRAYVVRDGQARQVTTDHSLLNAMVESGVIDRDQAEETVQRNVITRALGTSRGVPDLFEEDLRSGDVLLFCSDGLHTYLTAEELAEQVGKHQDLESLGKSLLNQALERGGHDNTTLVLVSIR